MNAVHRFSHFLFFLPTLRKFAMSHMATMVYEILCEIVQTINKKGQFRDMWSLESLKNVEISVTSIYSPNNDTTLITCDGNFQT